ncbi:AI-2E family transporter [Anaerotignum sp.]|uniref:AI-2E family transporter n=1 Tax=Anaerotignum sp. TaxID=2039241 RepID=UPI0029DB8499|nr:AI-2E family transporter [Anaerotignum sp.]MCI6057807.1 AI-2E family transporter [Clostridia bacterium]MDY3596350.1 AI-2E family transporter [Anaerotignum sp.]
MRLPWNRKYLEIGFHVILTAGVLVLLGAVVFHLSAAKNVILETARHVLAVFAPFFWSVGIAVVLEPLAAFWQRVYEKQLSDKQKMRVKNRRVGTGITYLLVFGVIAVLLYGIVHGLGMADLESLAEQAGDFTRQAGDWLVLFQLKLAEYGLLQNAEGILTTAVTEISTAIENGVLRAASILPEAGGQILNAAIGFAAAFYFLSEKENVQFFLRQVGNVFLGQRRTGKIAGFFTEVYQVVIGYLCGQLLDAAIMGALFAVTFWFIGIPYGVIIGIFSGFSNLIPYFGAAVAFLLAVLSGLFSTDPMRAVYAAIVILLLQQLDSAVIVPRVVGSRVELHPVLVLLSLAVFGGFFGFWGLLFAVPLGALLKNFFFRLYEEKATKQREI